MGYHNHDQSVWKYRRYVAVILLLLSFSVVGREVRAVDAGVTNATGEAGITNPVSDSEADIAIADCQDLTGCTPTGDCTIGFKTLNKCVQEQSKSNATLQNSSQWKEYAKRVADLAAKEAKQEALAIAFKTSLSTFARQVAHDTAVWVASGGRGQKPLFITEGWDAYLKNAADSALGDFISKVGTVYGVNMCQPTLKVRLAITQALDSRISKTSRCSVSTMVDNWSNAISNPDFVLDYRSSMGAGENDVTYMMSLADSKDLTVSGSVNAKAKEAETNSLWKDIKNVADVILTPGTFIKKTFFDSEDSSNASIGYSTFTGTVADVIEEFLNTLVAQLLQQLKSGFFSGSGGGTGTSQSLGTIDLSSLFDSESSPALGAGAESAKLQYASLITSQTKVGTKVDILVQLAKCSDAAKTNPGPTDCVIDSLLQSAIKNKQYLINLPDAVKDRVFAPKINQTASLDSVIPSRSISILRKYSIVPVGWEFAAQEVQKIDANITLGQIMDCYYDGSAAGCPDARLKGLIDPYWVLKAPEEFCRKLGYSGRNTLTNEQNTSVSRDQECVDEQQCLEEDSKGNCLNYGYCTEQRRTWDLGTTCSAKYNTCSNFTSRLGDTGNWLTNTLDFSVCTSQNAGCRSYATDYSYPSSDWNGEFVTTAGGDLQVKKHAVATGGMQIGIDDSTAWQVAAGHSVSSNGRLKISQPCSSDLCVGGFDVSGCQWNALTKTCNFNRTSGNLTACTVPRGGFSCIVDNCFDTSSGANMLSGKNGNFALADSNPAYAASWTDELSYLDSSDRHYRVAEAGGAGSTNSLKLIAASNDTRLITTLPDISVDSAGKYYLLKFYAKGSINLGSVRVSVYNGDKSLYGDETPSILADSGAFTGNISGWKEYSLYFNSAGVATATIAIITEAGSITNMNVSDFRLYPMSDTCQKTSIALYTPEVISDRQNPNIYFNRNVSTCASSAEGCSQFIRLKQGLGSNLLVNGGFEYFNDGIPTEWTGSAIKATSPIKSGASSISLKGIAALSSDRIATGLQSGRKYALSGYVYTTQANTSVKADIVDSSSNLIAAANVEILAGETNLWKHFEVVFTSAGNLSAYSIRLVNNNDYAVYFDDIQFEQLMYSETEASAYSSYNPSERPSSQVSYLKKAQTAFNCYLTGSGTWPTTAAEAIEVMANRSSVCAAYAPVCAKEEVGCELYTPTNNDPAVPGVATDLDLCPSECNGYSNYKQESTNFVTSTFHQFIANDKAKYCSASYSGCDEFTNLDTSSQGGEQREYYTRLKACQKPSTDDASYYTWEGSDTVGYQLKAYNLKRSDAVDYSNGSLGYAPCTNLTYNQVGAEGQSKCQESTQGPSGLCTKSDMLSNDDCREFYDTVGNIHYRLSSLTVTVSDNCHPYRRTQTQNSSAAAQTDCQGSHGYWNNSSNECVYMAIPNEGGVCSAEYKGCREYTGNTGNNIRYVINALNFSTTLNSLLWTDGSDTKDGLLISSESTFVGGSSLSNKTTNNTLKYPVTISKNKAYSLSFWAKGKAKSGSTFDIQSIYFKGSPSTDYFNQSKVTITNDWRKYDLGPVFITYDPEESSEFIITLNSGDQIYLDNLILKELNDSTFVVENSWYTPQSCDNKFDDANGNKALAANNCVNSQAGRCSPGEMLGCRSYKDRAGTQWYLKSFTSLCRREAAGCEALIDTANSNSPYSAEYNSGIDSNISKVTVPADKVVYLVNDSKYSCASSAKGCQGVGLPTVDKWDQITDYVTQYLINDPENYATTLCKHSELWCEEYNKDNSGFVYFKNPGSKLCDYDSSNKKWYKSGTTEECNMSLDMTFGTGYDPAVSKLQPQGPYDNAKSAVEKSSAYSGFAGNCPASETSCNEYVDPYSDIYANLIPNKLNGKSSGTLTVKANVLYYVDGLTIKPTDTNGCGISPATMGNKLFYLSFNGREKCSIVLTSLAGNIDTKKISPDKVAYAGVYYAKATTVDNSSCSGSVNYRTGCILMNSRANIDMSTSTLMGRYQKNLIYDSTATYLANLGDMTADPVSVSPVVATGLADTNVIMKAAANRTCAKWLTCTTYQKTSDSSQDIRFENTDKCLNIGVCSAKDENGACIQYEASEAAELSAANMRPGSSGYAVPNALPVDQMDQWGSSANVPNGNFETVMTGTTEPVGWNITASSSALNLDGWAAYKYSVGTQSQYVKFDSGYLQISGVYGVDSDPIDVERGAYVLDFWVNTQQLSPETAYAAVFISAGKSGNIDYNGFLQNVTNVKTVTIDGQKWKTADELMLGAGMGWTERSVIVSSTVTDNLSLKILNLNDPLVNNTNLDKATAATYPNYYNCYDLISNERGKPEYSTSCNISGSSSYGSTYVDNISLRPVLRIKGAEATPKNGEMLSRTCRAYPSQDAKSCQYYSGSKFYYGWYGYCLLEDPQNEGQCLQWYPIDELKGDVVDEYSAGYSDRQPLYYCVEAKKSTTTATVNNFDAGITSNLLSHVSNNATVQTAVKSIVGDNINVIPFTFNNPATTRFLRYPIIERFSVRALAIVVGAVIDYGGVGGGIMYYSGTMEKSRTCFSLGNPGGKCNEDQPNIDTGGGVTAGSDILSFITTFINSTLSTLDIDLSKLSGKTSISKNSEWGGWGEVLAITQGFAFGVPISSWDLVEKRLADSGANVASALGSLGMSVGLTFNGSTMGAKIVTDTDGKYAGSFTDTDPNVVGNILGVVWGVSSGQLGANGAMIYIEGSAPVYYCTKIVEVVTSMGQNKAWTNRVAQGSQFSFVDSDRPGQTAATADLLVSPCSDQAAAASVSFFNNPYCLAYKDSAGAGLYDDIDPTQLGYQFDGYGSDYKPYGAMVAPDTDTQNPALWDSYIDTNGLDLSRQPIYWEPPLLDLDAPYQPRMGQPVVTSSLAQLFAKAYRSWTWVTTADKTATPQETDDHEGYYLKDSNTESNAYIWDVPNKDCAFSATDQAAYIKNGYVRDVGNHASKFFCRIPPEIVSISVNSSTVSAVLNSTNPARLDFTVRVDKDQLPLTSYGVEWGDGDRNNTNISGVKLRARANAANPFTLYHLYDFAELKAAAGTSCTSAFSTACPLVWCADTVCHVRLRITATDNWRSSGSKTSAMDITVIQD